MNSYLDSFPEPTEDDMILLTAEEYLEAIGQGDDPEQAARRLGVAKTDLLSEIDGQIALIDSLVDDYNIRPDEGLAAAIEEAKIMLGHMLVDKGNLPGV
ncbi:MAG: hypothetical protein WAQ57_04360 [Candidatus Saccharimonadales bacterium]